MEIMRDISCYELLSENFKMLYIHIYMYDGKQIYINLNLCN